jgi:hypothetical protein
MSVVNITAKQQKQGSLIAGIGALISIAAFLLLPYFNIKVTVTNNTGFNNPQTNNITIPAGTGFISILTGLVWVDALLAIAVLVLVALVMWRNAPFSPSTLPAETQIRRTANAMLVLGIAGIAFHFLFFSIGNSQINNFVQSLTIGPDNVATLLTRSNQSISVSLDNAFGSWIYAIGMGMAIVGGGLILRALSPQAVVQPQSWPQYAQYSQPSQPQQPQPSQPLPQQGWQPAQAQQPQAWPQSAQTQQQGWQPTQQAQPPQGWQQPPQPEQRWQQPPSFPSS